jgi:hypothetical protein
MFHVKQFENELHVARRVADFSFCGGLILHGVLRLDRVSCDWREVLRCGDGARGIGLADGAEFGALGIADSFAGRGSFATQTRGAPQARVAKPG